MIKKLAKAIREYKKDTILTPLFVTGEVIMEVLIPLLMADLLDKGIYAGDMNAIYKIGVELVILALMSLVFGALSGISASKASAGFAKNIRQDMYYKVQDFSFKNIDKFSTASIITRLTTDVTNVQRAFQILIRVAVRAPLMLIFSLICAIRVGGKLSCIFLILIPLLGTGLFYVIKKVHPIMKRVFRKYDNLNKVVEENVTGIRVVKSFVLEDKEIDKFEKASQDIRNDFVKAEKLIALNSPMMQISIYSCIVLISWFGSKMIVNSHMTALTTGELTTLISYSIQILSSLMMLSMVLVMITIARASAERICELLDEKVDLINPKDGIKKVKNGDIEFKNVGFSYIDNKKKECLKNINLKIKSGEMIGIIGGTGSSKSSLINLIPRLYDTTTGTVYVGGVDVRKYDINALRDEVANVLQKNVLFSGTIIENIRWGKEDATIDEIKKVCDLAQASEFIEKFPNRYETYIEQGGTNVSGGQKQRICIARALIKKPKIIILDDSTSAVDTKTDSLIRKSLAKELPETTKIIIAQRILSVMDADKIIVMDNGEIKGIGTHKELLKNNAIYKEVYESQKGGLLDEK